MSIINLTQLCYGEMYCKSDVKLNYTSTIILMIVTVKGRNNATRMLTET